MKKLQVDRIPITEVTARYEDGIPQITKEVNSTTLTDGEVVASHPVVDRHQITLILVRRIEVPDEVSLQMRAEGLKRQIEEVSEALELDELDRVALHYARVPASDAPSALQALALIMKLAPEAFGQVEVNLEPARLEALADRGAALELLVKAVATFLHLLQHSLLEQGDEMVELLTVGLRQAQTIPKEHRGGARLREAIEVLAGYHERARTEGAHRSAAEAASKIRSRKGT